MSDKVKPVPEGYHTVTPYFVIDGAADAIEFYCNVFGATEIMRMPGPDGRIGHAEIKIGDSHVMLADEHPEMGYRSASSIGGSPISIMLYVDDVDSTVARAVEAGATLVKPIQDQFYGDRSGTISDKWGYQWHVATHVEDVAPDELERRAAAQHGG
jgi:PhnB protein